MSWLSSFIKNPIQPITHAIGNTVGVTANTKNGIHVDPKKLAIDAAALAIPGVGGLITKGLGAIPGIGGALATGATALGGAESAGLSKAAQALGLTSALRPLLSGTNQAGTSAGASGDVDTGWNEINPVDPNAATGDSGGGSIWDTLGGVVKSIPGIGGALSSALGSVGSNPLEAGVLGLAGANAVQAANAAKRGGQLQDQALQHREDAYTASAPLRTQGLAGMQAAMQPRSSLDPVFANPANPFYVPPRVIQPAAAPALPTNVLPPAKQLTSGVGT